jgi:hypothetical protein
MRGKALVVGLAAVVLFCGGCGVNMSEESHVATEPGVGNVWGGGVNAVAVVGLSGHGDSVGQEKALVLMRSDDGSYYVINLNSASAKKVGFPK